MHFHEKVFLQFEVKDSNAKLQDILALLVEIIETTKTFYSFRRIFCILNKLCTLFPRNQPLFTFWYPTNSKLKMWTSLELMLFLRIQINIGDMSTSNCKSIKSLLAYAIQNQLTLQNINSERHQKLPLLSAVITLCSRLLYHQL